MDLSEDMVINVANINESYLDQPSKYAWWATLATLARSKANMLKRQIDKETDYIKTTLMGSLDGKVRKELELNGEKVTEGRVQNAIYADPEYLSHKSKLADLQADFDEADEQARLLEVGRETMNQRKEMLISLGAQLRTDFDGNADIRVSGTACPDSEETREKVQSIVGARKKTAGVKRQPVTSKEE